MMWISLEGDDECNLELVSFGWVRRARACMVEILAEVSKTEFWPAMVPFE